MTDDVDWATETTSDGAPWYGVHKGKQGVGEFFEEFGKAAKSRTSRRSRSRRPTTATC